MCVLFSRRGADGIRFLTQLKKCPIFRVDGGTKPLNLTKHTSLICSDGLVSASALIRDSGLM